VSVWCDRMLVCSPYYYGLCISEEQFHRELQELGLPRADWPAFLSTEQADATAHRFKSDKGAHCILVCIRFQPQRDGIEVAALLVHEAMHIWRHIREHIGEQEPSAEFEAYSVQWISQQLMLQYRQYLAQHAQANAPQAG
jgi:hypothetical protein